MWLGDDTKTFLAFRNGLVEQARLIEANRPRLRPHSPDWFSTVVFDYDYEKSAKCPRWLAFLADVLEGDVERIALLQEWFGYLMVYDQSQQKFLVMVGEGQNGKGVTVAVLTAMLGADNVSNVALEDFGRRFALQATLGKLANICSEFDDVRRVDEGTLKKFTAGDRMSFDRKNMSIVHAHPTARVVLTTNSLPKFADRSGGVWRRMMVSR